MIRSTIKQTFQQMAKHPIITVIVVLGLTASLLLFTSSGNKILDGVFGDGPDSGMDNTLTMVLTDSSGNEWSGTMDLDEPSRAQSISGDIGSMPLSAVDQTIQGIIPDGQYQIQFIVKSTATPEDENITGIAMTGTSKISGHTTHAPDQFPGQFPDESHYISTLSIGDFYEGYTSIATAETTFTSGEQATYTHQAFTQISNEDIGEKGTPQYKTSIWGSGLDGSVFNISVEVRDETTGGFEYYGKLFVDLTITVDHDGNTMVVLDDVDITVTGG